jgi:hypothetical protein
LLGISLIKLKLFLERLKFRHELLLSLAWWFSRLPHFISNFIGIVNHYPKQSCLLRIQPIQKQLQLISDLLASHHHSDNCNKKSQNLCLALGHAHLDIVECKIVEGELELGVVKSGDASSDDAHPFDFLSGSQSCKLSPLDCLWPDESIYSGQHVWKKLGVGEIGEGEGVCGEGVLCDPSDEAVLERWEDSIEVHQRCYLNLSGYDSRIYFIIFMRLLLCSGSGWGLNRWNGRCFAALVVAFTCGLCIRQPLLCIFDIFGIGSICLLSAAGLSFGTMPTTVRNLLT